MLDDIARERHGMIETQGLVGVFGGFFGFDNFINLFFGFSAGLGEKNLGAVDSGSLDV